MNLSIFSDYPELVTKLSKRADGSMKFTSDPEKDELISHNREQFLNKLSIAPESLVSAQLAHGNTVAIINSRSSGSSEFVPHTDALLTKQKNIFLSITVADCIPIYLYEPSNQIIGIIHAGWRGLAKNIIHATIEKAQNELGLDPTKTLIAIGPSIGPCHFEVQQDVVDQFTDFPATVSKRENKMHLDLRLIAKDQIRNAGIIEEHIEISPICTYEDATYFSHRRDSSDPVEAMIAVIGLAD